MTNTKVFRRVLLTALPAAAFGAIALALALLVATPAPVAAQAADPEVRFVGDLNPTHPEGATIGLEVSLTDTNTVATQDITVTLSVGGVSGLPTVTIVSGTTSAIFSTTLPSDDDIFQAPSPVRVALIDEPGYSIPMGPDSGLQVDITITDDDVAVGFGQTTYTATEGSQVTVRVELKGRSGNPVVVPTNPITVSVQIVAGQSSQTRPFTLTNALTSAEFVLPSLPNDARAHASPSDVTLEIINPQGFGVQQGFGMARVRLTDDGDPIAMVGFSNSSYTVPEGGMAMLSVELQPSVPATRAVSVTVSDGEGFSEVVMIQNGQMQASFSYTAPDDDRAGATPMARMLRLSAPMNGSVASGTGSTIVSFTDDDRLVFRLVTGAVNTVVEGSEATLRVETVNRVRVVHTTRVRVEFRAEPGFGDAPADATAVFMDGDNSVMLTVRTPDNDRAGRPTALTAELVPSGTVAIDAAQAQVTLTLLDDGKDLAVAVFEPPSDQRILQGSRAKFVARLQGGLTATEAVTVRLTFSDDRPPQAVTIPEGESEVEFEVRTTSSGPTPPPLRLLLASPGARVTDAAQATLIQTPPLVDAATPAAGGVALGWGALVALLALALLAATTGGALLTRRARRSR